VNEKDVRIATHSFRGSQGFWGSVAVLRNRGMFLAWCLAWIVFLLDLSDVVDERFLPGANNEMVKYFSGGTSQRDRRKHIAAIRDEQPDRSLNLATPTSNW
jgi:hypothetical protein